MAGYRPRIELAHLRLGSCVPVSCSVGSSIVVDLPTIHLASGRLTRPDFKATLRVMLTPGLGGQELVLKVVQVRLLRSRFRRLLRVLSNSPGRTCRWHSDGPLPLHRPSTCTLS